MLAKGILLFKRIWSPLTITSMLAGCFLCYTVGLNAQADTGDAALHRIAGVISANPPDGFSLSGSARFFGTTEKELEDGTIFDYIDGAGENHIRHGFTAVCHIVFENTQGDRMQVDIFDMSSSQNAAGAFADENICASGSKPLDLGVESTAKEYSYPPDYMIYFVTRKYLVHINLENDLYKGSGKSLASEIIKLINEE